MADRWSIYLDVEGFGSLYEKDVSSLLALRDLGDAIYRIGTTRYSTSPTRIFAHQTGDGFVVVSDFHSESLADPLAIAIAVMRHVAAGGGFLKASVAEGGFGDITGTYAKQIQAALHSTHRVQLGEGLMTVFPVMGTALINSVKLNQTAPSGALLAIGPDNLQRIPPECASTRCSDRPIALIDWVHTDFPLIAEVQTVAGLRSPTAAALTALLNRYFKDKNPPDAWKANTNWYLSLGLSASDA